MELVQPPTKPPRGVKNSKETSGLLMTVIRTLSTSDSNEQRDQERTKLEKEFKKSNQQLEHLVSVHHNDLTHVMNLFSRLSTLISHSRQKVHTAKENLVACKKLLTCRREELKKLWTESVEYKYTLQLLNEIEHIKEVPSLTTNCLLKKEYLEATRLITSALNISENTLKEVVGLQEVKSELIIKKQELFMKLVEELKEQIYIKCTNEVVVLKRQGSARDSNDQHTPASALRSERKILARLTRYRPRKLLEVPNNNNNNLKIKIQKSDTEYSDDPEYIMGNLIECVTLLNKAQEFLEEMKQSTQRELVNLTLRTTKELLPTDSPNILLEFLQILTEQFRRVVDSHKYVLEYFKKKYNTNSVYDLVDVWLKMQFVIQQLLVDYLDVQNSKKTEQSNAESTNAITAEQYDINSFFTKKKPQRAIKGSFFKFDNSSQNDGFSKTNLKINEKEKLLLCKPSPSYITQIFVPLSRFSEEMERLVTGPSSEQPSKLNLFLNDYVGKVYLGKPCEEIVINSVNDKDANLLKQPQDVSSTPVPPNSSSPLLTALTSSAIYTHVQ